MSVKLYVSEGQKRVEMELPKANNLQVLSIIRGLFGFMGYELKTDKQPAQTSLDHIVNVSFPGLASGGIIKKSDGVLGSQNKDTAEVIDIPKPPNEGEKKVQVNKRLPFINGEHKMSQSLGEKLGPLLGIKVDGGTAWVDGSDNPLVKKESQSHMEILVEESLIDPTKKYSGIRYINDIPHYQTYVYCKNLKCGQRKKVFVKESQMSVYCPACNTKHARRDATHGGFPEQDDFGNYFKADRLWVENHKPHQERIKSPLK